MPSNGAGRLVICPTPLGNLEDITLRSLRALRECDVIMAEDTRVTRGLLTRYEIAKPLRSLHERVEEQRVREVRKLLSEGQTVAVVTDAGMPGISDPGAEFVRAARAAGHIVEVLPGPSAFVSALVLSGFDVSRFRFDGFPPRKAGERRRYLRSLTDETAAVAWYEAPSRVEELLSDVAEIMPTRSVFVIREYTKMFEQQIVGTAEQVLRELPAPPRGEFALVLEGSGKVAAQALDRRVIASIERLLAQGVSARTVVAALSEAGLGPRNDLYDAAQRLRGPRRR